jgi:hypothetical protein
MEDPTEGSIEDLEVEDMYTLSKGELDDNATVDAKGKFRRKEHRTINFVGIGSVVRKPEPTNTGTN